MRSMTGFGRGEAQGGGGRATVEIKSVNRRQLEVVVSLPRELEVLEARVRDLVSRGVSRGRCEVRVQMERPTAGEKVRVDRGVAAAYARELTALAVEIGWPAPTSVEVLLRCPGVLAGGMTEVDPEADWEPVAAATGAALSALVDMRTREGEALDRDLSERIRGLRERHVLIAGLAPEVPRRHRDLLVNRLRTAGLEGIGPEDERVMKEVLLFADRCDIAEELARLESHFSQFDRCRESHEAVGRTLDFLAQEMHREINTVGNKAADSGISAEVVAFKSELERFREQVQNIE